MTVLEYPEFDSILNFAGILYIFLLACAGVNPGPGFAEALQEPGARAIA